MTKKANFSKLLIVTVSAIILFICSATMISGVTFATNDYNNIVATYLDMMNQEYDSNVAYETSKTLIDLNNDTYQLIECAPTGYMIICDASNFLVEYSAIAESPYKGLEEDLYYFGPSYYGVKNGDKIIDLKYDDVLVDLSNEENVEAIKEENTKVYTSIVEETPPNIRAGIATINEYVTVYGYQWTMVNNSGYFFSKTTQASFGDDDEGNSLCAFVAASLLLGYYDSYAKDCVPDEYMTYDANNRFRQFKDASLANELAKYGNPADNTSTTLRETLTKYFNAHGYKNMGIYDMITPFFSGTTLKNLIDRETPVILMGNLGYMTKPTPGSDHVEEDDWGGMHAVVLYGYKKEGQEARCTPSWRIMDGRMDHSLQEI